MLLMLQVRGLLNRKPGFVAAETILKDSRSNTQIDRVVDRLRHLWDLESTVQSVKIASSVPRHYCNMRTLYFHNGVIIHRGGFIAQTFLSETKQLENMSGQPSFPSVSTLLSHDANSAQKISDSFTQNGNLILRNRRPLRLSSPATILSSFFESP